jgi:hypothetical protein
MVAMLLGLPMVKKAGIDMSMPVRKREIALLG